MTLEEISTDGPAVRLRDLKAITDLSIDTLRREIASGALRAAKRRGARQNTHWVVTRADARRWLLQMGFRLTASRVPASTGK